MPGSTEWGQYYQQAFMDNGQATPTNGGFSDATIVTTSTTLVTESNGSPSSSHTGGGGQLTPTRSVSKPIRRRSRVSKKTPITLLNANANNFRALVQQFTGCATSSSPISFGNQRGPINLSFGSNNNVTSSVMAPFGNHNYSYQYQQQLQRVVQPPPQVQQHQQRRQPLLQLQENQQVHQVQPIDNNISGSHELFQYSLGGGGYNPIPNLETLDEFSMDQEDIALHDFSIDL
ncbi:hypothetical protein PRUPE_4G116000 [Prunus persica]|uniref:VQ domain-containing protein n=1 Tax=Prunus persica TaxID=3760 RepID=A0A251PJ81_PRUPE|nr:VQ motif-containing protein 22 [Prunus persica]ONI11608.1 hypothetical protein PRUPE_4G116000 [Prunus persica]